LVHAEARDLLDEVDLPRHIARAPGRDAITAVRALEAEPREDRLLLTRRYLEPDDLVAPLRPQGDHRALGQRALHVDRARPPRLRELDEHPRREARGGAREIR